MGGYGHDGQWIASVLLLPSIDVKFLTLSQT
jgi:hypothetical protein